MNLLFWNLAKNSNEPYIFDIMRENNIDIAIFSEYHGINLQLLQNMFQGEYISYNNMGGCDKIILLK